MPAITPDSSSELDNVLTQVTKGMAFGTCQKLDYTTGAAQSSWTVPAGASLAVITPTTTGWLKMGTNPTSTSDGASAYMIGGVPYANVRVNPGDKFSFIKESTNGTLYVTFNV